MIRMVALVVALLGACAGNRGPYVASIAVKGDQLLVEKCEVFVAGNEMQRGACFVESHTIPGPTVSPAVPSEPAGAR